MTGADREVVRRYYEEFWNRWDMALAPVLIARGARFLGTKATTARNRDELLRYVRDVRAAFPDLRHVIEALAEENGRVKARVAVTGTHQGKILGINPGGRSVRYVLETSFRVLNGRIVECRVLWDDAAALARQLRGEAAAPEKARGALARLWSRLRERFTRRAVAAGGAA